MSDLELQEYPYHNERCNNCEHSAEMHGVDCKTKERKCFGDLDCKCKGFVMNLKYHHAAKVVNEERLKIK